MGGNYQSTHVKKIPVLALALLALVGPSDASPVASTIPLLARTYHLGSFNQKNQPTWEFITAAETVDNWTTLLTIIDRPDAHSREELDRLAEGIMSNYKSHGGQILSAKTMRDKSGAPYNYLVAAFEDTGKHRYELNFVKVALASKNAFVVIYGARISDPSDYRRKAKDFLNQQSGPIGAALESAALPEISKLPRKEF